MTTTAHRTLCILVVLVCKQIYETQTQTPLCVLVTTRTRDADPITTLCWYSNDRRRPHNHFELVLEPDLNKHKNQLAHCRSRIAARAAELTSTPTDVTPLCSARTTHSPQTDLLASVCMCDQLEQCTRGTQLRNQKTGSHSRQRNQRVELGFMWLEDNGTPHPRLD